MSATLPSLYCYNSLSVPQRLFSIFFINANLNYPLVPNKTDFSTDLNSTSGMSSFNSQMQLSPPIKPSHNLPS